MGRIQPGVPSVNTMPPFRFVELDTSSNVDLDDNCRGIYITSTVADPAPQPVNLEFSNGTNVAINIPPFVQFPVFVTRVLTAGTTTTSGYTIYAIY